MTLAGEQSVFLFAQRLWCRSSRNYSDMSKVSPQRIIAEAVRLLELHDELPEAEMEALVNNIHELTDLSMALYRDGIINIEEWRK